jgi:HSP20 family protein
MHDNVFFQLARSSRPGRFNPNTDVFYDAEGGRMVVHVELAGADADSLTVAVDEQDLYITGTRVDRAAGAHVCGSLLQKEIEYGQFAKKIRLAAPVDVAEASANYHDGILTISLPLSSTQVFPARRTELRMTVRRVPV